MRRIETLSLRDEFARLKAHIEEQGQTGQPLRILEAGCGNAWPIKLDNVEYELTGVDLDQDALRIRQTIRGDLDNTIVGDLAHVKLDEDAYDVVYNSFVLEHVHSARQILDNFMRWLKPGGVLILRIPNPRSVYGFASRVTPMCLHVLYKKYVDGVKNAGKPGYAPYPVVYEPIVSHAGIRNWADERGLEIVAEYASRYAGRAGIRRVVMTLLIRLLSVCSCGALSHRQLNLTFVIRKPA